MADRVLRRHSSTEDSPPAKYTWYRSPDSVLVVAWQRDGLIPLVRQCRHGARREFCGVPAGLLERGESPIKCARREFREEVGNELLKPELEARCFTPFLLGRANALTCSLVESGERQEGMQTNWNRWSPGLFRSRRPRGFSPKMWRRSTTWHS